jgi:hypothetical protein
MSFNEEFGYVPATFNENMALVREAINIQFGLSYTEESFVGTNWYKFAYVFCQRVNLFNVKMSEIFTKLQEYITEVNLKVLQPATTYDGLIAALDELGYTASVKPILDATDAGILSIAVDVDESATDYTAVKAMILEKLDEYVSAGCFFTGDQTGSVVIDNGQTMPYAYHLPNRIPVKLKIEITTSPNSQEVVPPNEDIRIKAVPLILSRYRMGWNFASDRVLTTVDFPFAETIQVDYSVNDDGTWTSAVFVSNFDDLFEFNIEDVTVLVDGV